MLFGQFKAKIWTIEPNFTFSPYVKVLKRVKILVLSDIFLFCMLFGQFKAKIWTIEPNFTFSPYTVKYNKKDKVLQLSPPSNRPFYIDHSNQHIS